MLQRTKTPPELIDLTYTQAGSGPDVVLIHGTMTCAADMDIALFGSLKGRFRATAFDRPGHGGSEAELTGSAWNQAGAVHRAVTALRLKNPVVVGHSFGGAVALAYALRYPDETKGVVALAPVAFPEPRLEQVLLAPRAIPGPVGFWSHSFCSALDPLVQPLLFRSMFLPQAMPADFAAEFPFEIALRPGQMLADAQDAALMVSGLSLLAARYSNCETPIHVFAGDRDPVVNPVMHADRLVRLLPQGRLTRLPGLGHMIHHFAQAEIVAAIRGLHAEAEDRAPIRSAA